MISAAGLAALLSAKQLLIFDLDGTLVDSSPLHARAFNEAFAAEGIAVDYDRIAGLTTEAAVDAVARDHGLPLNSERKAQLVLQKRDAARRLIEAELAAIPGSLNFLRRARAGYRMALCTSGSRGNVEVTLRKIGIADWLDPVITADDVRRGKPDPEGFLAAAGRHGIDPVDCLVFEDAEAGLQAAAAAGMDAVPIASAARPGADWAMLNAALALVHA